MLRRRLGLHTVTAGRRDCRNLLHRLTRGFALRSGDPAANKFSQLMVVLDFTRKRRIRACDRDPRLLSVADRIDRRAKNGFEGPAAGTADQDGAACFRSVFVGERRMFTRDLCRAADPKVLRNSSIDQFAFRFRGEVAEVLYGETPHLSAALDPVKSCLQTLDVARLIIDDDRRLHGWLFTGGMLSSIAPWQSCQATPGVAPGNGRDEVPRHVPIPTGPGVAYLRQPCLKPVMSYRGKALEDLRLTRIFREIGIA